MSGFPKSAERKQTNTEMARSIGCTKAAKDGFEPSALTAHVWLHLHEAQIETRSQRLSLIQIRLKRVAQVRFEADRRMASQLPE
jgi:hypothetical protein